MGWRPIGLPQCGAPVGTGPPPPAAERPAAGYDAAYQAHYEQLCHV